jgi:hypothetical protein
MALAGSSEVFDGVDNSEDGLRPTILAKILSKIELCRSADFRRVSEMNPCILRSIF